MQMRNKKILGKRLKNLTIYRKFQEEGFDYILNPYTKELHRVDLNNFLKSHNLHISNLEDFIGLFNIGVVEIHRFRNGVPVPIYDLETGDLIGKYVINKCRHCLP